MRIAFIGLGNMGTGMARRLVEAKHDVVVYNRTPSKAKDIIGARAAASPAQAAAEAQLLVTMVMDDTALEQVLLGPHGALAALKPNAIHVSMSTISVRLAKTLAALHTENKTRFVAAPVFGRPPAAADGKLFVVCAGAEDALDECGPLFSALAQKVVRVGEDPASAHLFKVLGNFMLFAAIEAMAEAMALARAAGADARVFLDAMTSTIFSAPFYTGYGRSMVDAEFAQPAAVSVQLALKDVRLAQQSANDCGAVLPTASLVHDQLVATVGRGYGALDVSVLAHVFSQYAGISTTNGDSK